MHAYEPSPTALYAMNLGKQHGAEEANRVKHLVKPMNQEERVLYFSGWWSVVVSHMKAAIGPEAARAVVDAMKVYADDPAGAAPSTVSPIVELRDIVLGTAMGWQVWLRIGNQQFAVGNPHEEKEEAEISATWLREALARCLPSATTPAAAHS